MTKKPTDEEVEALLDQIATKVSRSIADLDGEILASEDQLEALKKRSKDISRAWNQEKPWFLDGVLTKDEIEFLSEFGGWPLIDQGYEV